MLSSTSCVFPNLSANNYPLQASYNVSDNQKPAMKQETVDVREMYSLSVPNQNSTLNYNEAPPLFTASTAINVHENTRVIYFGNALKDYLTALPTAGDASVYRAMLNLAGAVERVNGKNFVKLPQIPNLANSYITALAFLKLSDNYTNALTEKLSILYAELQQIKEEKLNVTTNISKVQNSNISECQELSAFQQAVLPRFRRLAADVNVEKIQARYAIEPFNERIASPHIHVFYMKQEGHILGTCTLNIHQREDIPDSRRLGYLSDLFMAEGVEDDPTVVKAFFQALITTIKKQFPELETLIVMAATNDRTMPILKCFDHAQNAGLFHPFNKTDQERLGIVIHFSYNKDHETHQHLP